MRIEVTQSGGFAGGSRTLVTHDTDNAPASEGARLREAVERIQALATQPTQQPVGADMLQYQILVQDGDRRESWRIVDDGSPRAAELKRLIDSLV